MSNRIKKVFADNKKKLVTFVTGGDPNQLISQEILEKIIENGADIIEIGMPFSDPMADGPTIQLSSNRAIKNNINLNSIFEIANNIRKINNETPIILMGYYNLILHYGINEFTNKCDSIGIDGLIIVDLQPEEDSELYNAIKVHDISLIRLITPNTTPKRLKVIISHASGFLYYVTVRGITGGKSANVGDSLTLDKFNRAIRIHVRNTKIRLKIIQTHKEYIALNFIQRNRNQAKGLVIIPTSWAKYNQTILETITLSNLPTAAIYFDKSYSFGTDENMSILLGENIKPFTGPPLESALSAIDHIANKND